MPAAAGAATFGSPQAYRMKMMVTSQAQGRPEKMNMDATGRWLKADCGNVKPIGPPARK